MKVKRVLRFYFSAESLERAFDRLIINSACRSAFENAQGGSAERICGFIGEKEELSRLWGYLDGVMGGLGEDVREALKNYAALRVGVKTLCIERRREIKRAVMKFRRRARRLDSFTEALGLVGKYYCLMG